MHLKTDTGAQAHFATVPQISRPRNSFSIAQSHKTTMQFDKLIPMYWEYTYPGDTISVQMRTMARLTTQIRTLFDDLYFDVHAWHVPMRLIQLNWARFQFNAQPAGPSQDNSSLTTPKIDLATLGSGGFAAKTNYDYFGFPTEINTSASGEHINNYLGRALNLIWNDNYRDENLQNPKVVDLDDGPDLASDYATLLPRGKRHDVFTSALTAAQKGSAQSIPLGNSAPVVTNGSVMYWRSASDLATQRKVFAYPSGGDNHVLVAGSALVGAHDMVWGQESGLFADLSASVGATVNQLRNSIAIQQLLEADARGGTRDVESIQHRWGVTVPDFRLQRPEYLGGSTWTFDGHVVPQTSESDTTPQGTLTQFSQAMSTFNVTHSFVEHGVFMILISARSNMTYQQGLDRKLSYRTRFDWYQPEFANLGEVAVKSKEQFFNATSGDNDTWGFQEYGYELRYGMSRVSAEMRSNYAQSLDSYHMAYDFASRPTLSAGYIESFTPISRNLAVDTATADPIQINAFFTGRKALTLPMYSVPGLLRL